MQSLEQMLDAQIANLEKLAGLLDQELHLISSRNAEALMSLLQEKENTLEIIQDTDTTIQTHYQQELAQDDRPEAIEQRIEQAQKCLDQCKYQTDINQKAVEQGQLRLTHLRNLMLEVRAKESLTYDKSGKPKGGQRGSGVTA